MSTQHHTRIKGNQAQKSRKLPIDAVSQIFEINPVGQWLIETATVGSHSALEWVGVSSSRRLASQLADRGPNLETPEIRLHFSPSHCFLYLTHSLSLHTFQQYYKQKGYQSLTRRRLLHALTLRSLSLPLSLPLAPPSIKAEFRPPHVRATTSLVHAA